MQPYYEPGSVAQPETPRPAPASSPPDAERFEWSSDGTSKSPEINLLAAKLQVEAAPAPAAEAPKAQDASGKWVHPEVAPRKRGALFAVVIVGVVLVLGGGASAYVFLVKKPAPVAVVVKSPTPSPSASPSDTPSPASTPSPTPAPTPVPTAAPLTVTVPTVAPTSDHPQSVTITSNSGLWLRSSATSVNKNNIIGWMPKGAVVSVDQAGDFWWHGSYKGESGYFASKFTQ